jgi:hypothetical protein
MFGVAVGLSILDCILAICLTGFLVSRSLATGGEGWTWGRWRCSHDRFLVAADDISTQRCCLSPWHDHELHLHDWSPEIPESHCLAMYGLSCSHLLGLTPLSLHDRITSNIRSVSHHGLPSFLFAWPTLYSGSSNISSTWSKMLHTSSALKEEGA